MFNVINEQKNVSIKKGKEKQMLQTHQLGNKVVFFFFFSLLCLTIIHWEREREREYGIDYRVLHLGWPDNKFLQPVIVFHLRKKIARFWLFCLFIHLWTTDATQHEFIHQLIKLQSQQGREREFIFQNILSWPFKRLTLNISLLKLLTPLDPCIIKDVQKR